MAEPLTKSPEEILEVKHHGRERILKAAQRRWPNGSPREDREKSIIAMRNKGMNIPKIADSLNLSRRTVEEYVARLIQEGRLEHWYTLSKRIRKDVIRPLLKRGVSVSKIANAIKLSTDQARRLIAEIEEEQRAERKAKISIWASTVRLLIAARPQRKRERWLSAGEAIALAGISADDLMWLVAHKIITVQKHPHKTHGEIPVAMFARSEIQLVKSARDEVC